MTKPELTRWFSGSVKPARKGVYYAEDSDLKLHFYCYWDGKNWFYGTGEWSLADPNYRSWSVSVWRDSSKHLRRWRGLAKQPKARQS